MKYLIDKDFRWIAVTKVNDYNENDKITMTSLKN